MDRLTSIDASFLAQERDGAHMQVGAVTIFEGPPPATEDFVEHIDSRLDRVPRYRQKLAMPRWQLGRPLWVDDPGFNIHYHCRHTALPEPGSPEQLRLLAGRIFSQRLDRSKPLWEIWLIEGLEDGRFALINKTHHSMVDGVAGIDIMTVLFDVDPVPPDRLVDGGWIPAPEPSAADLIALGVEELARLPVRIARRLADAATNPLGTAEKLRDAAEGAAEVLWSAVDRAPETPFNVEIGSHRRLLWIGSDLDDLKEIKNSLGGTVNDVFLTVVSGALGRWLRSRGIGTDDLELRGAVPISIRRADEHGEMGNKLTVMVSRLPTYCEDPVKRLEIASHSMERLKRSKQAQGAEAIAKLEDLVPQAVFGRATRIQFSTRIYNLLVSNVPGPQFPLYLLGREMQVFVPVAFLAPNQALAIAIASYNGGAQISLIGDYDALEDIGELAGFIEEETRELLRAARGAAPVS